jgi:homoserine O-acetyltransferase
MPALCVGATTAATPVDSPPGVGYPRAEHSAIQEVVNSADDERNPPELGILQSEIKRVKNGRYLIIPGSEDTAGHGTTARAKLWKAQLAELLQSTPRGAR